MDQRCVFDSRLNVSDFRAKSRLLRSHCVEDAAHPPPQTLRGEWLLEKGDIGGQKASPNNVVVGISRHVQHANSGCTGKEHIHELATTHPGHDDIRDHQIYLLACDRCYLERIPAVLGGENLIAA